MLLTAVKAIQQFHPVYHFYFLVMLKRSCNFVLEFIVLEFRSDHGAPSIIRDLSSFSTNGINTASVVSRNFVDDDRIVQKGIEFPNWCSILTNTKSCQLVQCISLYLNYRLDCRKA